MVRPMPRLPEAVARQNMGLFIHVANGFELLLQNADEGDVRARKILAGFGKSLWALERKLKRIEVPRGGPSV
jgi:hypothetical protein